jgi:hypothetical protein
MNTPRTLRVAGTEVARIGLGTNRLIHTRENVEFVRQAVVAGVGLIDTAHLYTGGQSETTIGDALSPALDGCVVATKGGFDPGEGRPNVLTAQIEQSLRRLRGGTIKLYYLRARGDRVRPVLPAAWRRRRHLGRDRRAPRRYTGADRPRVAPEASPGDAAHPGHALARAPEAEPRRARDRDQRRRIRGTDLTALECRRHEGAAK